MYILYVDFITQKKYFFSSIYFLEKYVIFWFLLNYHILFCRTVYC
jgi:hypothetical protein